jgi:chromosomal replication initiation ATPase DnaA
MLSSVLNSRQAIQVNIAIVRVFARIRQMLFENKDLALRMEKLERHAEKYGKDIRSLFDFVERIIAIDEKPKKPIGFHP